MAVIDFDVSCSGCGRSLRGSELTGACAGCGQNVGGTMNLELIDPDTGSVAADAACIQCGYNLRTMGIGSVCPECAKPVWLSLGPDELRFANTAWLRRVRVGVSLMLAAGLGAIFVPLVLISLAYHVFEKAPEEMFPPELIPCNLVIFLILGCVGSFFATSRDPHLCSRVESSLPAQIARVAVIAGPVLMTISLFLLPHLAGAPGARSPLLRGGFRGVAPLVLMLAVVCLGLCLRRLALRGRRSGLARMTTVVIGLCAMAGVLTSASEIGRGYVIWVFSNNPTPWMAQTPGSSMYDFVETLGVWSLLFWEVSLVLSLFLLARYRRLLAAAIEGKAS